MSSLRHRVQTGTFKSSSANKAAQYAASFVRFINRGLSVSDISTVTPMDVRSFVFAPAKGPDGVRTPSSSTSDNRRWAVKVFFNELVQLGLIRSNPAINVRVVREPGVAARPLTDEEQLQGMRHSARSRRDTRGPAAWALGRATAYSSELGLATVADLDLENKRVWLTGASTGRAARWGYLEDWDLEQLQRRIDAVRLSDADYLIYEGGERSRSVQSSSSMAIQEIYRRCRARR